MGQDIFQFNAPKKKTRPVHQTDKGKAMDGPVDQVTNVKGHLKPNKK